MSADKKVCLIGDPRLDGYTKRTRNGRQQVFYTGDDSRDFVRYKKDQYDEDGKFIHNVKMHDKSDTILITPPKKSYYADLIDGEWWWVESCAECNGLPRDDWGSYVICEEHDVCRTCQIHRSKLTDTPWGGKEGWQCKPCADAEHKADKEEALAAMPDDHDEWDYQNLDEIKCPYCNYEFSDSWENSEDNEKLHECPRCDNEFTVTAEHSFTFNCQRK